jgi:hypothetical protein
MELIGQVMLVQIQRASLKAGQRPHSYYDPAPLLEVPRLRLGPGGVLGQLADGQELIDVHNAAHADSKNRQGENGISLNFTSHYQAMRSQFGAHLVDGCAGENILIAADRVYALDDLGGELLIYRGDRCVARLAELMVAAPCVEFSRFANVAAEPLPADALKSTLQFLHGGMRGFYARAAADSAGATVQPGDLVFVDI